MVPLLALMLCLGCGLTARAQSLPVDVELVLAVDISRSMDPEEFALQRAGYVAALRHPDFLRAVRTGVNGRIALTYFEWAGSDRQDVVVPWQIIDSAETADAFATRLDNRPVDTFRGTSISSALTFGASLFDGSGFDGLRRVIDVSGDGPNNMGRPVAPARDALVERGIVINGLPIVIRPSQTFEGLDRYYAECVIGGPGAFVLPIRDPSEFATAIRRKLVLEVSGATPRAAIIPVQANAPVDCQLGERDRRFFSDPYFPEPDR